MASSVPLTRRMPRGLRRPLPEGERKRAVPHAIALLFGGECSPHWPPAAALTKQCHPTATELMSLKRAEGKEA